MSDHTSLAGDLSPIVDELRVLPKALAKALAAAIRIESVAITPRLLDLRQSARYLNVSFWTVRDYTLAGRINVVKMPPLQARPGDKQKQDLRRVLIDKADLDSFIEARKGRYEAN